VAQSRKMSYKARFKPFEVLIGHQWRAVADSSDMAWLMNEDFTK